MKEKKCPYCKRKDLGYEGKSIYYRCEHNKEPYYYCQMCGAKYRNITKEVVVKRIRLN